MSGKAAPPPPVGFVGEYDNHSVILGSGVRIGYHEEGRIEDPTLILLHGLNGHSGTWRKNISYLAKKHRVLAPSLPTHLGGIESLPIRKYVSYVEEFIVETGNHRVRLIGNSMGGWISMLLAGRRSEIVSACVLEDSAGANPNEVGDLPQQLAETSIPVLVVWGKNDGIISVEYGRRLASLIPHSEFVVLENVGHVPHWDALDEFNRLIEDFLSRNEQSNASNKG